MANTSATRNEVNDFLTQMRLCLTKLNGYVIYNTRDKNKQLMAVMDWYKEDQKRDWLLRLEVDDYFRVQILMNNPDSILFGNLAKGLKVIYVT